MISFRIFQKEIILAVLFAILHSLPYHYPHLWWVAFFSLVPFFFCISSLKSRGEAFGFGFFAGFAFFLATIFWLGFVTVLGLLVLCLFLGLFFGLFAALSYKSFFCLAQSGGAHHKHCWISLFKIASLWVLVEFLRSNVPVMHFPWALLGSTQWKNLEFIQIAEFTGLYGVSFVVAAVNLSLYALGGALARLVRYDLFFGGFLKQVLIYALIGGALAGGSLYYGRQVIGKVTADYITGEGPRVAIVQGSIPQHEKWDERTKDMIFRRYDTLSRQAALEKNDLIIWPETSFPAYWEDEQVMALQTSYLIKELGVRFLIGAPAIDDPGGERQRKNAALYLNEKGQEIGRYYKLRLVPFGEYVPSLFGFIRRFFDIGRFTPGKRYAVFSLPFINQEGKKDKALFSVLICFEDSFADMCRKAVQNGSNLLINITNDAWFEKTSAPYQHAQSSVFRAIENRVPVVRAANTGLSCVIDPTGAITSSIEDGGEELFVAGFKTVRVPKGKNGTFYTVWGDFFVFLCFAVYFLTLFVCRPSKKY